MPVVYCSSCSMPIETGSQLSGATIRCAACNAEFVVNAPTSPARVNPERLPVRSSRSRYLSDEDDLASSHDPAKAFAAVRLPAIGLQINSVMGILFSTTMLGMGIAHALNLREFGPNESRPDPGVIVLWLVIGVLGNLANVYILFGAARMKRLSNYSHAQSAAIVALIPLCNWCFPINLTLAIWALHVLQRTEIREQFEPS